MASRRAKEAAVTGHKGGNPAEILGLILILPLLIRASEAIQERYFPSLSVAANQNPLRRFVFELLVVALPLLGAYTISADLQPLGCGFVGLCAILVGIWTQGFNKYFRLVDRSEKDKENGDERKRHWEAVTTARGCAVLSTVIAILAVDFPSVFPRRFAKTEWFGTGLMDIGVGAFVFTGAIVTSAPFSRKPSGKGKLATLAALVSLGVLRVLANRAVDYQIHKSEYGLDWNFFMTLTLVKLVSDFFAYCCRRFKLYSAGGLSFMLGLLLLAVHQLLLSHTSVGKFVMDDSDRPDLDLTSHVVMVHRNKEGLISSLGYVSLHLIAQGLAWTFESGSGFSRFAFYTSLLFWFVYFVFNDLVQPASRRSANATFVWWILANGTSLLALSRWSGVGAFSSDSLAGKLSRNQLLIFLIANLFTGLVNLNFDTLSADALSSTAILGLYVAAVCGAAYAIEGYRDSRVVF